MKKFLCVAIFTFLLNASFAQNPKKETITIKTEISCDHCVKCGSCGANIYDAIYENRGIRKVKINPEDNTITVTYKSSKISAEEIKRSIAAVGFDADEMSADATAYSKLDACCKKPE